MPRGGGRKVTHTHRFVLGYMRFRLWRDCSVAAVFLCRNEKKSNPSFFFLLSRASLSEESISSFSKMMIPLSACAAEYSIGRSGFPKRSLLKRERERERDIQLSFPISPTKTREKEREDHTLWFHPTKRSAKERKKKRIDSQNISKKERERAEEKERERKRVFF